MPKLTVLLKQHTPIMHFQHEEVNATIRGTELKPRLDRFLIRYAMHGTVPDAMRIGQTNALAYRVKIETTRVTATTLTISDQTPYFTMGTEAQSHRAVLSQVPVCVTFLTPHAQLLRHLQQWVEIFFFVTNFGYRKNQGFGCFCVEKMEPMIEETKLRTLDELLNAVKALSHAAHTEYLPEGYQIEPPTKVGSTAGHVWLSAMQQIKKVYGCMKSGQNFHGYVPSVLMKEYAYSKGYSNEKRAMKLRIPAVTRFNQDYDDPQQMPRGKSHVTDYGSFPKDYRYVRAMLGLADHYDFDRSNITMNVTDSLSEITRFEGPLLFKPLQMPNKSWVIYVIPRKIPLEMYNHPFTFEHKHSGTLFDLPTPDQSEFDLLEFMRCVVAKNWIRIVY